MSKHTPGPWFVQRHDPWEPRWICGPSDNPLFLAKMGGPMVGDRRTDDATELANARLIAAAPDLLEAVQEAANELGCNDPHDLAFESEMCGRFRAVIARATDPDTSTD